MQNRKRDTGVQNRLLDSVGEGKGGMFRDNKGKSHGFSRIAAGTWGTFSSYDGDAHSNRSLFSEVRTLV